MEYLNKPHRFSLWCAATHGHDLVESVNGELVTHADYEELLRRLHAAEARLTAERITVGERAWKEGYKEGTTQAESRVRELKQALGGEGEKP